MLLDEGPVKGKPEYRVPARLETGLKRSALRLLGVHPPHLSYLLIMHPLPMFENPVPISASWASPLLASLGDLLLQEAVLLAQLLHPDRA